MIQNDLTWVFVISIMRYVFLEDHIGTLAEAKHIRRRDQIDVYRISYII